MRAQLIAIGLGIALLLPLAVYTGVNIFSRPPDWQKFYSENYDQRRADAKSKVEKQRISQEEKSAREQLDREDKEHEKRMFFVSFPIGVLAVVAGSILAVRTVGAGFMFGGILLLAEGCYTYWDTMTAVLRFVSVLVALTVFVAIGFRQHRYNRVNPPPGSLLFPADVGPGETGG
jgi:hypothetical protein